MLNSPAAGSGRGKLIGIVGAAAAALLFTFVPGFEGTVLKTYRDPVGITTACVGHTGPELQLGQTFTPEECRDMLAGDLVAHAQGVQDCVTEPMSDGEVAAYTSFAFNVGVEAFCASTAARKLNAGDHRGACAELSRWTRAGGRELPGLVKRRAAERRICEEEIQ
jgi:lysozyme